MMRTVVAHSILTIWLLVPLLASAQSERSLIREGNKKYKEQKYSEAENAYNEAMQQGGQLPAGPFNLGDALYKQERWDEAATMFDAIAQQAPDPSVRAQAYHNLGNSLFRLADGQKDNPEAYMKGLEETIEAYKNSLRANPKDLNTKYNLAYAQELLKKEEQKQEEQQQDDQNQDEDQEQQQDQEKQEQEQDQQQEQKEDESEGKENEQDPQENESENPQPKDGEETDEQKDAKPQPRPDRLTKEEAERLLEAVKSEEKNIQDEIEKKKIKSKQTKTDKDW